MEIYKKTEENRSLIPVVPLPRDLADRTVCTLAECHPKKKKMPFMDASALADIRNLSTNRACLENLTMRQTKKEYSHRRV